MPDGSKCQVYSITRLIYQGLNQAKNLYILNANILQLALIHTFVHQGVTLGRLRGLAVASWTTDHYHPCSNLGV